MRCISCFGGITVNSGFCWSCGQVVNNFESHSLFSKIKRWIGIEISSDLISLSLDEPERMFTRDEIESLINPENITPLDTEDVANWEIMFFTSKRVSKPIREKVIIRPS